MPHDWRYHLDENPIPWKHQRPEPVVEPEPEETDEG